MNKSRIVCCLCMLALTSLIFSGCVEEESRIQAATQEENQPLTETFTSESKALGDGIVYSWVTLDAEGKTCAVGVNFTELAVSGLPAEAAEYTLPLPGEASATAFNHIGIEWSPKGHEPQGIYDRPHFDVRFYMTDQKERDRITATEEDMTNLSREPEPEYIPEGYVATPGGVPRIGAHWIDPTSPEFNGQPFEETFIYGFYDGEMVFVEPMATIDFLKTKPELTKPLKLPESYPTEAYYPTSYSIRYDKKMEIYTVALEGMTLR
ncbi:DUF5602 domain-containing protein [Methanosarcina sp. T3]|uniref:DUF5602 domain-containing protein n=1 Tax=Methanosarcina sp. T3 TaxID=3439062 RepID=UPI003F8642AE